MKKKETQERQSLEAAQQGFLSFVSSNTNNNQTELSSEKTKIIKLAMTWLKQKFRNAHYWIVGCREDGAIFKIPATARGNETYAYYQSVRIRQIQQYLKDNIQIKYHNETAKVTNALFITLTQRYNPYDARSVAKTWDNLREASKRFKAKMRRLGMTEYVMTLEAHVSGGCHAHMLALMGDRGIGIHKCPVKKRKQKYRHGKEYIYRLNDIGLLVSRHYCKGG
jgi:hypothetical protein